MPGKRPAGWLDAALASVDRQPCNWYLIDGSSGHIGELRAYAFGFGSAEFTSFVDDDDRLAPGAIVESIRALRENPNASQTYSNVQRFGLAHTIHRIPYSTLKHLTLSNVCWHFHLFRRRQIEPLLDQLSKEPIDEEFLLCGLLCQHGPPHHIDRVLYYWRQHDLDSLRKSIAPADRKRTLNQVRDYIKQNN